MLVDKGTRWETCAIVGFQQGITQGMRQGKSLGLAEGSRQKALETARLMKQASCEITFIEKMTGLSKEEIETMQ